MDDLAHLSAYGPKNLPHANDHFKRSTAHKLKSTETNLKKTIVFNLRGYSVLSEELALFFFKIIFRLSIL